MISAGDLKLMRDTVDSSLGGSVVIRRATWAADNLGGSTATWANVGTVAGRVDPITQRSPEEREQGGRMIGESSWAVILTHNADVRETDRIVNGTQVLEVLNVTQGQTWQLGTRCECVEAS